MELEIIEAIILGEEGVGSEKRYRIRVKGTNIILNIRAESPEEAFQKAEKMLSELE